MRESPENLRKVLDSVRDMICTGDAESFAAATKRIPEPVLQLFATYFADGDIRRYGFMEFLKGPAGILAPEAVLGFEAMEMPQIALLVKAAIAPLGEPFPRARPDRLNAMLSRCGKTAEEVDGIFERAARTYDPDSGAPEVFGRPEYAEFRREQIEHAAYRDVTAVYRWYALEHLYCGLIDEENGGFEEIAANYAERILGE